MKVKMMRKWLLVVLLAMGLVLWASPDFAVLTNPPDVPALHPASTQVVSFTDMVGINSQPIKVQTVRVVATQDCYIRFHKLPSETKATSSDMLLPANHPEYFLMGYEREFISVVQVSTGGKLFITSMTF